MSDASSRVRVPAKPPATVRRKMPAPFSRPSITISGPDAGPKREWRHILACDLRPGDTVPGVGVIDEVTDNMSGSNRSNDFSWTVTIRGGDNNTRTIRATEIVLAYTATTEFTERD